MSNGSPVSVSNCVRFSSRCRAQGFADRSRGDAGVFMFKVAPRFHPASDFCHSRVASVLQSRFAANHSHVGRMVRSEARAGSHQGSSLFHTLLRRTPPAQKNAFERLLSAIIRNAHCCGLIEPRPRASLDATGMESHHVSRHFLHRTGRCKRWRRWPKLTLVCHNLTHLIVAAEITIGPSNDSPAFKPVVAQATASMSIDELSADGAYDSEQNHQFAQNRGVRNTIIPVNLRGAVAPRTGHRRKQLHRRFPRRRYRQRAQVESVISRLKRRLGSALRNRSSESRTRECLLRVLALDLMILRPISFQQSQLTTDN